MKVKVKILWKLRVMHVEADGLKGNYDKRQMILVVLKRLGTSRFLVSFRRRNELLIAWPTEGEDNKSKYSHSFKIYSYSTLNYIITTL